MRGQQTHSPCPTSVYPRGVDAFTRRGVFLPSNYGGQGLPVAMEPSGLQSSTLPDKEARNLTTFVQKLGHKLRRATWPKRYRHMASYDRRLKLVEEGQAAGLNRIIWRGQEVGQLVDPSTLNNRYQGHCFIVCSGPSLREIDFARLAGHPCFGVNGAVQMFAATAVPAAFHAATDADFFEHRFALVERMVESHAECFFSVAGVTEICRRRPQLLQEARICLTEVTNRLYDQPRYTAAEFDRLAASDDQLLVHPDRVGQEGHIGFSTNLTKGLFCGRTIGYRAIQIAYFLGFRRVFLVGMDLGGAASQLRFYDEASSARPSMLEQDYERWILPSFEVLGFNLNRLGLEVYNLSPTSRLPASVLPRLSFDAALEMAST
jgi:Kdo-III transferase WaaZ